MTMIFAFFGIPLMLLVLQVTFHHSNYDLENLHISSRDEEREVKRDYRVLAMLFTRCFNACTYELQRRFAIERFYFIF